MKIKVILIFQFIEFFRWSLFQKQVVEANPIQFSEKIN